MCIRDRSTLRFAIYGGSAVDSTFLKEMAKMAPGFGTGMGMTETAGFYTFTARDITCLLYTSRCV